MQHPSNLIAVTSSGLRKFSITKIPSFSNFSSCSLVNPDIMFSIKIPKRDEGKVICTLSKNDFVVNLADAHDAELLSARCRHYW